MEDNKSLTQEELNLYYYEKIIEKTYLFTRKLENWADLSHEPISEFENRYYPADYTLFYPDTCNTSLMFQVGEKGYELYLKDLLNLFTDPLEPTPEEFTLFNLEYGVDYIIKPNGEK